MIIILVSQLLIAIQSQKIYQALNESSLINSNVQNTGKCVISPNIDYQQLDTYNPTTQFSFSIAEPHYEVDIYIDVYLMGDFLEQPISLFMDGILIEEFTVQYDNSIPFCDSSVSNQLKTFTTSYTHYKKDLNLMIQIISIVQQTVGIRNIQIIPKICHQSCTACVGPKLNQCRSCHMNALLSRVTNQCKCPTQQPFLSLQTGQCLQKCELYESYNKDSQICSIDKKIEQLYQYFWSDYNFDGWNMIENTVISSLTTKTYIFSGGKVVGLFLPTQSVTYKFNNTNQFQSLRIRADIYIFQSTKSPQIYLQVDKITFQTNPLFNQSSALYQLYQIDEVIDCDQNSNITITIQSDASTRWGINNIVLNQINCQSNCAKCSSKAMCNTCNTGYYLYLGQCVLECPKYTNLVQSACVDVVETLEQPTTVLLRAFDDNITQSFVVKNTNSILSYNQTKFGTYYNGFRYFGGLKDNHNQFYSKVFTQLPPHYAIIIQFNIVTFQFILTSSVVPLINSVQLFYDKQNLKTIEHSELPAIFDEKIQHNSSSLKLTMLSIAKDNTQFSFGIRDLNIMIQRCSPLCRRCKGPAASDCLEWIYEQNSNGNNCNSGFIFDIQAQKCVLCPIGCSQCTDQLTCTVCDKNFIKQGNSCFCQNGYIDEFTLDCIMNQ